MCLISRKEDIDRSQLEVDYFDFVKLMGSKKGEEYKKFQKSSKQVHINLGYTLLVNPKKVVPVQVPVQITVQAQRAG